MDTTCVWASVTNYQATCLEGIARLFDELTRQGKLVSAAEQRHEAEMARIRELARPTAEAMAAELNACGGPTVADPASCKKAVEAKYSPLLAPFNAMQSASTGRVNAAYKAYRAGKTAALAQFQAIRANAAAFMAVNMPISCVDRPPRRRISRVPPFGLPSDIVPDVVYMSQLGDPGFISQATTYHDQWKIPRVNVTSLEEVLDDIPKQAKRRDFSRVRMVTHATKHDLFLTVFKGGTLFFQRQLIVALADGDISLLRALLFFEDFDLFAKRRDFGAALEEDRSRVALQARNLLLQSNAFPSGLEREDEELVRVYLHALALGKSIELGQSLTDYTGSVPSYLFALKTLTGLLRAEFATTAGDRQLGRLETAVRRLVTEGKLKPGFKLSPLARLPATAVSEHSTECRAAAQAVKDGLRGKIGKARDALARNEAPVWIDIRGCDAGRDVNQAIVPLAALFDISPSHISAPDANQYFAPIASGKRSFECDPPEFATTASKEVVRRAVRRWAALFEVDVRGFYWRTADGKSWHALDAKRKLEVLLSVVGVLPTAGTKADLSAAAGGANPIIDALPEDVIGLSLVLSYEDDCVKRDVRHLREVWMRTMWADAGETLVGKLAREWEKNTLFPFCPVIAERRKSVAIHGDPDYQRHIVHG